MSPVLQGTRRATRRGTGHGSAFGAVTIVNATATGIGCALAVAGGATAVWTRGPGPLALQPPGDDGLLHAVAAEMEDRLRGRGGTVRVECAVPPSRGLKTSSSVAAALVRAAAGTDGQILGDAEVETIAVAAARRAGVTLTGALDDQVATVRGGCHVTDNRAGSILRSVPVARPWAVALWVPDAAIPKDRVRSVDVRAAAPGATRAIDLAKDGQLAAAMTENGRAYHAVYAGAGLPVDDRPARVALERGALGAGLSGTGPAVAALFDKLVDLPAVPGGAWRWTKAVPAQ